MADEQPIEARSRPGGRLASVALFVSFLALAGVLTLTWQQRQSDKSQDLEVARRLTEADHHYQDLTHLAADLSAQQQQTAARLDTMETRLNESLSQQASLQQMYDELVRNRDEWVVAEVEQLLHIANEQLTYGGNVRAALQALETADDRLQHTARPQYMLVRQALARDITALQAVPVVDVPGDAVKLAAVTKVIDILPPVTAAGLAATNAPAAGSIHTWRRFVTALWQDVTGLVRIQRMDTAQTPYMPPSDAWFLRENLRLRLLAARIALLSHNNTAWQQDIGMAQSWIKQNFDTSQPVTRQALKNLNDLALAAVSVPLPDISDSLKAVHALHQPGGAGHS